MAAIRARSGQNPPLVVAAAHGLLAATGLVLLIVGGLESGFSGLTGGGLGVLVLSALGGAYLLATHLRGGIIPLPVVGVHAAAAVLGVILLVVAAVGGA